MLNSRKIASNEDGNVSMMFAAGVTMLLIIIGAGVDYSNIVRVENSLQSQVDAAVLAAATADVTVDGNRVTANQENAIRQDVAFSVLEANGFDLGNLQPEFNVNRGNITLKAELAYNPFFGKVIGQTERTISAVAESGAGYMPKVEIALVLDNTLSMLQNGKMTALKTGAINLVNAVEESNSGSKIALVPFARYVRIDEAFWGESWLDVPEEFDTTVTFQQATHTGGTCHIETQTRIRDGFEEEFQTEVCLDQTTTYEEVSEVRESRFRGCVGTRLAPYSEQDANYAVKIPGLLNFIPHQALEGVNRNITGYCPRPIIPLTDDYSNLESKINKLSAIEITYLPSGLIWGQRVLSPGLPFDNAQSDAGTRRIMVMMTDGKNTARINTSQYAEEYYFAPPRLEWVTENEGYSPEANVVTARMCESIKAEGIELVTIAFQVTDPETKTLLQNCATDPSNAYTAESNQSLINTFEQITVSLTDGVRLIR